MVGEASTVKPIRWTTAALGIIAIVNDSTPFAILAAALVLSDTILMAAGFTPRPGWWKRQWQAAKERQANEPRKEDVR